MSKWRFGAVTKTAPMDKNGIVVPPDYFELPDNAIPLSEPEYTGSWGGESAYSVSYWEKLDD